ncbi:MAG: ATP-binding protein [Lachnospiraceae bacterium]|nr:ATP-binding protein [Lachnospiraceae bacterium]
MSYSHKQFNEIMSSYEEQRRKNRRILDMRKKEVYENIPGLKALDDEIADISTETAIRNITEGPQCISPAVKKINELSEKKALLMREKGYDVSYLKPVYDCPDCRDTGYRNGTKCHCLKQKIIDVMYRQSDIYPKLKEENFDTFSFEYFDGDALLQMKKIRALAEDFVDSFAKNYVNMLFYGNVGSGKTFITNCIAEKLIDRGYSVIYLTALRLFELLNGHIFRRNGSSFDEDAYNSLFDCSLLIIDDLGTEVANSATVTASELFQILNERDNARKSTIISSNLSLEQLKDNYSERSFSRILGGYELIRFNGEDIRLKKRRQA